MLDDLKRSGVVIVDSDATFISAFGKIIGKLHEYVLQNSCENGLVLIDYLKRNHESLPQIIVVEIKLCYVDGLAIAQYVRDNYPKIKVIVLTNVEESATIIQMLHSGVRSYLLKKDLTLNKLKLTFESILSFGLYINQSMFDLFMMNQFTQPKLNEYTSLSKKQIEFIRLASTELTYKEIAAQMDVSIRTLEGYRISCFKKLKVKCRVGIVRFALTNNMLVLNNS